MTLVEFAEEQCGFPIQNSQKRFFEEYEKARNENSVILTPSTRFCINNMFIEIIDKYETERYFDMKMGQFNRANQIRGRIR